MEAQAELARLVSPLECLMRGSQGIPARSKKEELVHPFAAVFVVWVVALALVPDLHNRIPQPRCSDR